MYRLICIFMLVIPCLSFGAIDAYNGGLTLAFRNAIWHGENRNINQGKIFAVGKGAKPIGSGSGLGHVELVESDEDGSSRITVDLNDIYASTKVLVTPKGHKSQSLYDNNLLRIAENFVDTGITGKRAWGIDYSGKSGAPVTLVLVDEIHGGNTRVWQWPLPAGSKRGPNVSARYRPDGFTLTKGSTSLNCTFVTPLTSEPNLDASMVKVGQLGNSHKSFQGSIPRVVAEGEGHFIAVITISKGEHPAVTTEGDGLNQMITVGEARYRYDGKAVRW